MKFLLLALVVAISAFDIAHAKAKVLFNFQTDAKSLDGWKEYSDVQFRNGAGASKADIVFLKNKSEREAVFFAVANAVEHEIGWASVLVEGNWDLSSYEYFLINCRAVDTDGTYSIGLRQKNINNGPENTVYAAEIEADDDDFRTIEIPISAFKPVNPNGAIPLDTSDITSIAIAFQAESDEINVGVLEITWIGAY